MNLVRIFETPFAYVLHTSERHPTTMIPKPNVQSMGTTPGELVDALRKTIKSIEECSALMQAKAEEDGPR
jgi:DNA-directed RNA polymerase subunit L